MRGSSGGIERPVSAAGSRVDHGPGAARYDRNFYHC